MLEKDIKDGAKATVRGTPTFFINGRKTRARSVEQFTKEINDILSKDK